LSIVISLLDFVANLPILKQFNEVGGIIYGLLRGVLIVCVCILMIGVFAKINPENELNKYQNSSSYIKNNKMVILKIVLTTYIQYILFYAISYFVYCSFGLKGHSIIEIVTLQSVLYATVSGIPSPGAVGVSEGGFIAIFSQIFPESMVKGAMLLNRGISFYLVMLIGLAVFCVARRR